MTDLNKVIVCGRLTRDAQLKYTKSGSAIIEFAVAVNRSKNTADGWKDEASFFDVSYFTKSESLAGKMLKGKWLVVEGSLKQERWQGTDGVSRSKIVILADRVFFAPVNNAQSEVSKTTGYRDGNAGNDDFEGFEDAWGNR